jgi:hypothetical protein
MMLSIPMNYFGFWRRSWHLGDADLNCFILMLRMIMLMLSMSILYILYKEGACWSSISGYLGLSGAVAVV